MDGFKIHLGSTGVPFLTKRNSVPMYKNDDPSYKKPQSVCRVRNDIFDLSKSEDLEQYNKIWEAVGYRMVTVLAEDKQWDPSVGCWKVLIRWFLSGEMDPGELRNERRHAIHELYSGDEP